MGDRHQISIHALREEGDQKGHTERRRQAISIHALREEGDLVAVYVYDDNRIFLSTPSARRATKDSLCMANLVYISIHALREEGDPGSRHPDHPASISIHALREEGDRALWSL